ncbi:MAG TPA: PLP-dependent aminotransferase family protein [Clostridiaceae bacterium]|nr:PLP-dependent aminotransferase family protein [Clostridiaceae bacterium]
MDMLAFMADPAVKSPVYHQLYTFIKAEIRSGRIPAGTRLPSKRKLSAFLGLSQNTIQTAYEQLIEEGYAVASERKGFYASRIDNVVSLESRKAQVEGKRDTDKKGARYDFSYHGVDTETFPFPTWRKLMKAVLNEYDEELLLPGNPQGYPELRSSITDYLHHSRGVNCHPDQVIVSAGTEYLFQILIQLFGREKVYGIENPGYEKLSQVFSSNKASFRAIRVDEGGMDPEAVTTSGADILCITPAHQFPTGEIMPIMRRVQLLNWANGSTGRYLIEDDYDSEFKYSGKPVPALQGLDTGEKVIYMGTFSKSLSPSLRVSYMVLPQHLLKRYQEELSFIICPVPIVDQKVLSLFIREGYFERHLNRMRILYRRKREELVRSLRETGGGIRILGADAGLHLLLTVDNGMSEAELVESAFRAGTRVYGVSKYYVGREVSMERPTVLLGFASMKEEEISSAVERIKTAWFLHQI